MVSDRTLRGVAWGLFFIAIGGAWAWSDYSKQDIRALAALSIGLILVGLNLARAISGIGVGKFSLVIGLLALLFGGASYAGFGLPLLPTIVILLGLFIVAEAVTRR